MATGSTFARIAREQSRQADRMDAIETEELLLHKTNEAIIAEIRSLRFEIRNLERRLELITRQLL